MKNKLLAVLATFGMVASASAVKINNNLSINGFIDGSYSSTDAGAGDTSTVGIDEVELNFLVNAGNVSGELHIDNNNVQNRITSVSGVLLADGNASTGSVGSENEDSNLLDIEQVHFTYSFGNGASLTIGQFGSALGFEREDPAGLYTYSRAYGDDSGFNLGNIDAVGSQEGFRLGYASGDLSASLALYNEDGSTLDNGTVNDDFDYEVALSYAGIDNLTVGAGIQNTRPGSGADTEVYTINAAYTLNKVLLAAEYINSEVEGAEDLAAYMILADYDVNDKLGVAIRYSNWETAANAESDKLTFAPNYAITDSLGAIIEFSAEESSAGAETDSLAVELTYTF
jgi:hypothetical protein